MAVVCVVRELPIVFQNIVKFPIGAEIRGAGVKNGSPAIWSIEDDDQPLRNRYIYIVQEGDSSLEDVVGIPQFFGPVVLNDVSYLVLVDGEPDESNVVPEDEI